MRAALFPLPNTLPGSDTRHQRPQRPTVSRHRPADESEDVHIRGFIVRPSASRRRSSVGGAPGRSDRLAPLPTDGRRRLHPCGTHTQEKEHLHEATDPDGDGPANMRSICAPPSRSHLGVFPFIHPSPSPHPGASLPHPPPLRPAPFRIGMASCSLLSARARAGAVSSPGRIPGDSLSRPSSCGGKCGSAARWMRWRAEAFAQQPAWPERGGGWGEGGRGPHRRTDVPVVTALRPSALFFSFFHSPERAATYFRPSVKKDMQGGRELCERPVQVETVEE